MPTSPTKKKLGTGRHYSALKRNRQNIKLRLKNKSDRSDLRTSIKAVRENPTNETLKVAVSKLARAGRKNLVHPRKASRLTSRLTKIVTNASA